MGSKAFWVDLAERVVATFVEAFAGILLLAGPINAFNLSTAHAALAAGGIAVLAVVKGAAASFLTDGKSASLVSTTVPVEKVIVPDDKITVVAATAVKKPAAKKAAPAKAAAPAVKKAAVAPRKKV